LDRTSGNVFTSGLLGSVFNLFDNLDETMKDARKIIVLMFALTICAIMVAIISSWIYYGSAKPESVNILGHLIDTMLGAIIAYLMLKPNDNNSSTP